jgi:hypothetical protein
VSSVVTIGFLDRTRVCLQTEFTPPLADDERRELLIHAALLTGRAFAALSYERQGALASVLREWVATRFETCPLQIVDGDPMACPHRFASTFLAPPREYALATSGGDQGSGGIEYFLPMAAAAYLKQVTVTDHDPEELLKPALALCAAVAIHPITVANHFQMAAASLPKFEPVIDRTESANPVGDVRLAGRESRRHLLDRRRSLIVSACLAALVIMAGVQYLSTREPKAGDAGSSPQQVRVPPKAPAEEAARAYLRRVRDLAESSLAQVEVMAAATEKGMGTGELSETFEYGTSRLSMWRRQFFALTPPQALQEQHREIGRLLTDLGRIAQTLRSSQADPASEAPRARLSAVHDHLTQVLNDADAL